jgi:hypothetical protein
MSRTLSSHSVFCTIPCFMLFVSQRTGGMAAQIRRCTRAVLGVSISIFKAKYSTKKRCDGHPPRIIQLGRISYSSLLRQRRKLVNPHAYNYSGDAPWGYYSTVTQSSGPLKRKKICKMHEKITFSVSVSFLNFNWEKT